MTSDFVVEKGQLKAYLGSPDISGDFVIPEGVKKIGSEIFQENIKGDITIIFPSTFEKLEENSFDKANVVCYDFSKAKKVVDMSSINLKGTVNKIILPTTLKVFTASVNGKVKFKDVYVSDGEHVVNNGFELCPELEILDLKGITLKSDNFIIPSNIKKFEQGGLTARQITILPKSKLKIVSLGSLDTLSIPYGIDYLECQSVNYVFFEKSALNLRQFKIKNNKQPFVFENIDIANVTYHEELEQKGINYYSTNNGLIITQLDNTIAKFKDIPTEYDGKKILALCVNDPFDSVVSKSNLDGLNAKLTYTTKQYKENADKISKNYTDNMDSSNYSDDTKFNIFLNKSEINETLGFMRRRRLYGVGAPVWKYWVYPFIVPLILTIAGIIISSFLINNFILNLLVKGVQGLGVPIYLILVAIMYKKKKNFEKEENKRFYAKLKNDNKKTKKDEEIFNSKSKPVVYPKLNEIYKQIPEPFRWKAIAYIAGKIEKKYKECKQIAEYEAKASEERFNKDLEKYRKERVERQQKEIISQLNAINDSLKNSSASYDIYDVHNTYLGRIDKD